MHTTVRKQDFSPKIKTPINSLSKTPNKFKLSLNGSKTTFKSKLFKSKFQTRFKAGKFGLKFSKKAVLKNESTLHLKKAFDVSPLLEELLVIRAFVGDFYKKSHRSQESLILGYKNKFTFYNIQYVIKLFAKAAIFVKKVLQNKSTKFVFVGNPANAERSCSLLFRNLNIPFFPNDTWRPGFFSIKKSGYTVVLVIYNPSLNILAFNEAVNKNIPIVGFATPTCDIRGLDYPIVLNLENSGMWYSRFWKTLLNKK